MTSLTHDDLHLLKEGLQLLQAAPPHVATILTRRQRLDLQGVLLHSLHGWRAPSRFTIYWRHFFSWSAGARVACGEVHWLTSSGPLKASFAVDRSWCTLRRGHLPSLLLLAVHLGSRGAATSSVPDPCRSSA